MDKFACLRGFHATGDLRHTGMRDTPADSDGGPFNVLGTGIDTTLVPFKNLLIPARAREAEVDRTLHGFPHLPA